MKDIQVFPILTGVAVSLVLANVVVGAVASSRVAPAFTFERAPVYKVPSLTPSLVVKAPLSKSPKRGLGQIVYVDRTHSQSSAQTAPDTVVPVDATPNPPVTVADNQSANSNRGFGGRRRGGGPPNMGSSSGTIVPSAVSESGMPGGLDGPPGGPGGGGPPGGGPGGFGGLGDGGGIFGSGGPGGPD